MRMSYMKARRCLIPNTAVTQSPQQPPLGPALPAQALAADLAVYALAHLGDDLLVRLLDLLAGERMVIGAIRKREGHGLFAHAHADRIAVDVEQAHALEQLAAGAGNTAPKILAGHGIIDHDSQVVLNSRVLRELAVVLLIAGALDQLVQVELKGNDDLIDAHRLARLGVNFADPAQHGAAGQNLGGTTRL